MKSKLFLLCFFITVAAYAGMYTVVHATPVMCYPAYSEIKEGFVACGTDVQIGSYLICNTVRKQYQTIRCNGIFITDDDLIPHNSSGLDRCLTSCVANPATACTWVTCRNRENCGNVTYNFYSYPCSCNPKRNVDNCVNWSSVTYGSITYPTLAACNAACQGSQTVNASCTALPASGTPPTIKYRCDSATCQRFFCTGNAGPDSDGCWAPTCTTVQEYTPTSGSDPVPVPAPSIDSFEVTNIPFRVFSDQNKGYYLLLKNQASIYNLNIVWSTDYASSCTAGCSSGSCSNDWRGSVGTSGTKKVKNVAVAGEHIYTLTCSGAGGSKTATLRVIVKAFSWFEIIPRLNSGLVSRISLLPAVENSVSTVFSP